MATPQIDTPPPADGVDLVEDRAASNGRRLTRSLDLCEPARGGGRPPAPDVTNTPPVRLTVYVTPDQYRDLRAVVAELQVDGKRSDMSRLIRYAIERFLSERREQAQRQRRL